MIREKAMSWRRVAKSAQALAAHAFLFCFTLLLVLKLDHAVYYSWWLIFFPLWLFHAVVARGRFSLPAPSVPHGRHWAPCHAIVATPLLIAFELLLCIYLESIDVNGFAAVNLKIVFLPLLAFEIIILIDNFRMCKALLPGDDESVSDEAIWETLPYFLERWLSTAEDEVLVGIESTYVVVSSLRAAFLKFALRLASLGGSSETPSLQSLEALKIKILLVHLPQSSCITQADSKMSFVGLGPYGSVLMKCRSLRY